MGLSKKGMKSAWRNSSKREKVDLYKNHPDWREFFMNLAGDKLFLLARLSGREGMDAFAYIKQRDMRKAVLRGLTSESRKKVEEELGRRALLKCTTSKKARGFSTLPAKLVLEIARNIPDLSNQSHSEHSSSSNAMSRQNSSLPSAQEIEAAREDMEKHLDETTLLPIFLSRNPARMQAAIEMITDGSITSEHFFHDHPSRMEIDATTGKPTPKIISVLSDLIEMNKSSRPDLSLFAEGQFTRARKPEEQLLEDFDIVNSVLSACRSNRADNWIRQSATNPELIASIWSAFAKRLATPQYEIRPGFVDGAFLRGLSELETLPLSNARAVSASAFACLVHVLDVDRQYEAFKRTVQIVAATPDTGLICNIASSLVHLEPRSVAHYASYLMNNARISGAFHALPEAIGKVTGTSGRTIEEWYDSGCLDIELIRLVRAGDY